MRTTPTTALAALTLALAATTAETTTVPDPPDPVTLRMARTTGFADAQINHFTSTLAELSGGELVIEIATEWDIGWTATDVEQQIVGAVADGDVDLGWVGSRAFGTLGVPTFSALTAPLLVDSYELQAAILDSDLPERMIAGLDDFGVTGLAVIAGGLRKPIGVDGPLLSPADYAGATVHAFPHGAHDATLTSLGATTASGTFDERDAGLLDGTIDGYENTLAFFQTHLPLASHVTLNVSLWPATAVVFANPDSLVALDDTQRGWLRAALADTVDRSVEIADVDAVVVAGPACANGASFATASDADLAALRDAVEPMYTELRTDPDTAGFIAEIEALKESITVEPLTAPDGCAAPASGAAGDERLPDGVYRSPPVTAEMARVALSARGLPESASDFSALEPGQSVVFTLEIEAGTLVLLESLDGGPETVTLSATFEVVGDDSFTVTAPGDSPLTIDFELDGPSLTTRWALDDATIEELLGSTSAPYVIANTVAIVESAPYTRLDPTETTTEETVSGERLTLRMGTPYDDGELQAGTGSRYTPAVHEFVSELERLSGGTIDVEIVWQDDAGTAFSLQPDGEQQVVQAVIDGDVDLAWAGTRVFDTFDATSFQALHAPFLVDSYALQEAIVDSDLPTEMLAGLEPIGLEGLAVLAGGLRKPIGREAPLLNPDDYAGITFQIYRSDVQASAIEALGATVTDVVAAVRDAGLAAGEIDGHEHSLRTYVVRGNPGFASYVTANVNLWPETVALIANPDALAALTPEQQEWVREAAATASAGSVALYDEEVDLLTLACAQGATVAEATEDDLAALRQAVEPVYDELRSDAQTADLIDQINELKVDTPAAAPPIPEECGAEGETPTATVASTSATLEGLFRAESVTVESAAAALAARGLPESAADEFFRGYGETGTFALRFEAGRYVLGESYDGGPESVGEQGAFEQIDDETLVMTPDGSGPVPIEFEFDGTTLTLRIALEDAENQQVYAAIPEAANFVIYIEAGEYTKLE